MKSHPHSSTIWLLFVMLAACTSLPETTEPLKLAETTVAAQKMRPAGITIPADLTFSTPLVQLLSQSGLTVLSVQSSTYTAMFPSSDNAAWIKTDKGILDAVFFVDVAEARQIHIIQPPDASVGRYLYTIQAPAPTLLQDQIIDAAFPLYFTVGRGMFMVTSSMELDKSLKRIFSVP